MRHWISAAAVLALSSPVSVPQAIPLPEHPRPDFQREDWQNLNGPWQFQFDAQDAGQAQGWFQRGLPAARPIVVPFPWGSLLSGVPDSAPIGWYHRTIDVPAEWTARGRRVFLVVGAADWRTTAWLDGRALGSHDGGYVPFEFELTPYVKPGQKQLLVLRVDDAPRAFKLEGKQGYGNARGIWQTPYLEARGGVPLRLLHFSPDIDRRRVLVSAGLLEKAPRDLPLTLRFKNAALPAVTRRVSRGADQVTFEVPIPNVHRWTLDDPFLYEVEVTVGDDRVQSYFGMRKISVVDLPGSGYRYVALNDEPVYLQLALDQAFHPEGFYTFPSDSFVRDEILRAKRIGLNGLREHVKVESPRKLYWADRLGLLIMADVPNSWGEPDSAMRREAESTLRGMIERDYNHPAIFAWVLFNETWGLLSKEGEKEVYRPATQAWVASVYRATKQWDPTRLVEDNSPCCGRGHTETDINSWHAYLPGWAWEAHDRTVSDSTFPGSPWNFEAGYRQARQPDINSEFGNVWGYQGSTGDVDWSWDYHRAVNAFRRHPRIAGWLYTELHDVINEWNGYWRFNRSEKETGFGELVEGMTLRDLHAPLYVAVGEQLSDSVSSGAQVRVPLYASFLSGEALGDSLTLRVQLYGWNALGQKQTYFETRRRVPYRPWMTGPLDSLVVPMPNERAVLVLLVRLEDATGTVLHRNFCTFVVEGEAPRGTLSINPAAFHAASWSLKQWNVMDSLKVNGAGSGFFEYRLPWPQGVRPADLESVTFLAEVSSKELFGKDREGAGRIEGDFMLGRGTVDPSLNPNAYPMTDGRRFPSAVTVRVNDVIAGREFLEDDPADSRGILSWHFQKRDRRLRESGSYGTLLRVTLPREALERAARRGELVIRLEVDPALPGGLAIYGRHFGRYPLDPTLVFVAKP
jgi:Glycosyl hydrolases family 2, sugar binding domain/Glycosyl hydrolases family 2, TIM barrel domain/Glycosyl hydrolases family 2